MDKELESLSNVGLERAITEATRRSESAQAVASVLVALRAKRLGLAPSNLNIPSLADAGPLLSILASEP